MTILIKMLAVVTAITVIATSAFAHSARYSIYDQAVAKQTVIATNTSVHSARDIRGASPYVAIKNEAAPKLIVDTPLPEGLAQGIFWSQYRVKNLRIVAVFGAGAVHVSPRVGHLHITLFHHFSKRIIGVIA